MVLALLSRRLSTCLSAFLLHGSLLSISLLGSHRPIRLAHLYSIRFHIDDSRLPDGSVAVRRDTPSPRISRIKILRLFTPWSAAKSPPSARMYFAFLLMISIAAVSYHRANLFSAAKYQVRFEAAGRCRIFVFSMPVLPQPGMVSCRPLLVVTGRHRSPSWSSLKAVSCRRCEENSLNFNNYVD